MLIGKIEIAFLLDHPLAFGQLLDIEQTLPTVVAIRLWSHFLATLHLPPIIAAALDIVTRVPLVLLILPIDTTNRCLLRGGLLPS